MPRNKDYPTPGKVKSARNITNQLVKMVEEFDASLLQMSKVTNLLYQIGWHLEKIKIIQEEMDQSDFIREFAKDKTASKVPPQIASLSMLEKTYIILFKTLYAIITEKMKEKAKEAKNKKEQVAVNPLDAFKEQFGVA